MKDCSLKLIDVGFWKFIDFKRMENVTVTVKFSIKHKKNVRLFPYGFIEKSLLWMFECIFLFEMRI